MEMFRQVVGGRSEDVITRTDIIPSSDSESESHKSVTKITPAGKVTVPKPSEATLSAQKEENALEEKLEAKVGVTLNEENSEEQADKFAKVDEMKQEIEAKQEGKKEEAKPDIKQLAEQIKVLAEQIATLQAANERGASSSPEPSWEKIEKSEKSEGVAHAHSHETGAGIASGSGCPFMP
jgi:hypothetical protein